jgi:predicted PurR-regulated permease PerM
MWALGLPTPALWGMLTVVVEFVPYLGAMVMVVLLAVAGLATFGSFGHAMLAPAAYLGISTLQNNLVSPLAYGRGLKLSPAVILFSVMVWWFLWGVAGAFVAVPVVAALKVVTEHVPSLKRFSDLLAD